MCEHHAGGDAGPRLDPRRPLPAGGGGVRRRRELRRAAAVARVGVLGIRRGRHRRLGRRGRHTFRPAPARDDPGHGGRGSGGGICQVRFRTRAAADLRGPGHGDREQRVPRHPARRRAHWRHDGAATGPGRGPRGGPHAIAAARCSSRTRRTRRRAAAARRPRSTRCARCSVPTPTRSSSPTPRASPVMRWALGSRTSSRSRRWRPAWCRRCRTTKNPTPNWAISTCRRAAATRCSTPCG